VLDIEAERRAPMCIFEAQAHRRLVVPSAPRHGRAGAAASRPRQRIQQVPEVHGAEAFAVVGKLLAPLGWWREFLAGGPAPELVLGGPLFGILQGCIRFADLLELRLGAGGLGHVGMTLARERPIRLLDRFGSAFRATPGTE
jgi:hypothetical protein